MSKFILIILVFSFTNAHAELTGKGYRASFKMSIQEIMSYKKAQGDQFQFWPFIESKVTEACVLSITECETLSGQACEKTDTRAYGDGSYEVGMSDSEFICWSNPVVNQPGTESAAEIAR
jgi:hypothetical protein